MKSLLNVLKSIETESDSKSRQTNKTTFFTLLNYLQLSRKGISEYDMENFLRGNAFSVIFQKLVDNSIIEKSEKGNYYLNDTTKIKLSPILNELTSMNYKTSYGLVE